MLDRASTFADPRIVNLLQTRFVPAAIDQFYQRQQKDAEGTFYRKIAAQGPWKNVNGTTQGLYIATADGKLLGFVELDGGRVVRLDMVAKGLYWGDSHFTRGAPKGRFPLAVAFSLASGDLEADRVPPQGSKGWLPGYIQ